MPSNSILIVDDTPNNIRLLFDVLDSAGFDISVVKSGETALEKLPQIEPDLILLDVMMPGIDGFETCRRIKSNPSTQDIPIIFMTALSDTENKISGLQLGAVDYVTKPIQVEEVLARVNVHLSLRNAHIQVQQEVLERKQTEVELKQTLVSMQQIQMQLIQSEKMSALGNLVAGVAHEINNPLGFLNGSLGSTHEYIQDLLKHLHLYQKDYPHPTPAIANHAQDIDIEYICEDLPKIFQSMQGATKRIQKISNSLRTFSRADTEDKISANLHEGIDSTIMILKYRLKANEQRPAIEVITEYGELPNIECFPGQLNQVFMNILANAIDALDESNTGRKFEEIKANPNKILVKTSVEDNQVKIIIADNGKGMKEEVKHRIFDHLFTTKGVGKGTGLGLAIARQIIEDTHTGKITVNSVFGEGTEFIIFLPIKN
ncbi:sensor histidine kinase [Calothrix sp. UHCC 0171]|uniref:sensor histidine kinase n=1 Tax=Calothrix sp. UHCC 0171 TaxID=3110245 RepID=UPI002B21FB21|nr:response regulator [Calothrix sp. UHCC 0171]MEA5569456.1 response regulator [Calothrix sp. UHCC 0171]